MRCMETSPSPYGQYNNKYRQPLFQFDLQLFAGEKTEEPTAKRKADARKKGQVGKSQEINAAFVLLAGFMVLKVLGGNAVAEIMNYSTYIYGNLNVDINEESIMQMFIGMIILLAKTSIPLMVFIMIIGLAMNLAQVGLNFSTETISFDPNKLNPINGAKRMFSKRSLVELIKSLFKIIIIGYLLFVNFVKDS